MNQTTKLDWKRIDEYIRTIYPDVERDIRGCLKSLEGFVPIISYESYPPRINVAISPIEIADRLRPWNQQELLLLHQEKTLRKKADDIACNIGRVADHYNLRATVGCSITNFEGHKVFRHDLFTGTGLYTLKPNYQKLDEELRLK